MKMRGRRYPIVANALIVATVMLPTSASAGGHKQQYVPVQYVQAVPVTYVQAAPVQYIQAAPVSYIQAAPVSYIQAAPVQAVQAAPVAAYTWTYPAATTAPASAPAAAPALGFAPPAGARLTADADRSTLISQVKARYDVYKGSYTGDALRDTLRADSRDFYAQLLNIDPSALADADRQDANAIADQVIAGTAPASTAGTTGTAAASAQGTTTAAASPVLIPVQLVVPVVPVKHHHFCKCSACCAGKRGYYGY